MLTQRLELSGVLAWLVSAGVLLGASIARPSSKPPAKAVNPARAATSRPADLDCAIQGTRVERERDGAVDCRVILQVVGKSVPATINMTCHHRTIGIHDWMIQVTATNSGARGTVDSNLMADAILLAIDTLRVDHPSDPVASLRFDLPAMPSEFKAAFYKAVAGQMRRLDSKPIFWCDPKAKKMVLKAYQQMDYVRHVRKRLEEAGYSVDLDTGEHCCVEVGLEKMAWKDIADRPNAGLIADTAPCWLGLKRTAPKARAVPDGVQATSRPSTVQDRESVDQLVRRINRSRLPARKVDDQLEVDSGSGLTLYGTKQEPKRIHWRIGLSSTLVLQDYYLDNRKLVFVSRKRLSYPYKRDGTPVYDDTNASLLSEEKLYFSGGALVGSSSQGRMSREEQTDGHRELDLIRRVLPCWDDKVIDLHSWLKEGSTVPSKSRPRATEPRNDDS